MQFTSKAIEFGKEAIAADQKGDYPAALEGYIKAIQYFMSAIKFEENEQSAKVLNQKVKEYVDRAEYIKGKIEEQSKSKGDENPTSGSSRSRNDGKDDSIDKENARFENILSGAIVEEKPNVHWDDVAGLMKAKEALKESVLLPTKFPHLFTGKRKPWSGILLYGPPGTGKSYLAKAVATEIQESTFFSVSSADLMTKWLGESEKLVRTLFQMARARAPSIIFIDEIDSLCSSRGDSESESARRVKTEFLVQMDGVGKTKGTVLVLAATNLPNSLDSAIRRRFQKRIYIPLPEAPARARMFQIHIGNTEHTLTKGDMRVLGKKTEGFSGSDIAILVKDALLQPVRKIQFATHFFKTSGPDPDDPESGRIVDDLWTPCSPNHPKAVEMNWEKVPGNRLCPPTVNRTDFMLSCLSVRPSVAAEDLKQYEDFTQAYGSEG